MTGRAGQRTMIRLGTARPALPAVKFSERHAADCGCRTCRRLRRKLIIKRDRFRD